jgi:hypothetical protein
MKQYTVARAREDFPDRYLLVTPLGSVVGIYHSFAAAEERRQGRHRYKRLPHYFAYSLPTMRKRPAKVPLVYTA